MENMQELTRQQEIDSINGHLAIKRSELDRQKAELDQQIQQFDQEVKQSDHGMTETEEQIEFARRKKLERQQQVDLLLNNIQHLKARYENIIAHKAKLCFYQRIAEEMLQIDHLEVDDNSIRTAIYTCFDKFGTANGLCLDCLYFLPQNCSCAPHALEQNNEIQTSGGEWVEMQ